MTFRRPEPPPPSDPPSVLLMRAIAGRPWGKVQLMEGGEPITGFETVALMCGLVWVEIAALIEVGITVGYLDADDNGTVRLSAKGQRWYGRGRPRGSILRRE